MLLPAYQKGFISLADGARIPYVSTGDGEIPVVLVPGAGDGFRTVADAAFALAWLYRARARRYRVLFLSRREPLPPGFTMAQHAADFAFAVRALGVGRAVWECNSAAGPIGQHLAVTQPDLVGALVLTCTLHRASPETGRVVGYWIDCARQGRWQDLAWSAIEYTYRPQTVARYRLIKPLLPLVVRPPRQPERLPNLLEMLLDLDQSNLLPRITQPVFVAGGADDRVIPASVQREMAALIPGSRLKLYEGYGHGNDQENPQYHADFDRFVEQVWEVGA